jgi:hypothetical protein
VVETALARALDAAVTAQRWELVEQLARELEARRLAREGRPPGAGLLEIDAERPVAARRQG